MATFTQALEWLNKGRIITREHRPRLHYTIREDMLMKKNLISFLHGDWLPAILTLSELNATDWQLYNDGQQKDKPSEVRGNSVSAEDNLPASAEGLNGGVNSADTSLTTELSVSPSLAAKILKLVEKENKRKPRRLKRRKSR